MQLGCLFLTAVFVEVTAKWSWDPREGCRGRLSTSAAPHAASCLQLSYSSVLGSVVLGRVRALWPLLAALHCPWGTEKWVGCEQGEAPILLDFARLSLN